MVLTPREDGGDKPGAQLALSSHHSPQAGEEGAASLGSSGVGPKYIEMVVSKSK